MSIPTTPSPTPNVVIENPKARKIARTVLDIIGVALAVVVVADMSSDGFDLAEFTTPALAVYTVLRAAFGIGVDNPNTPKS